MHDSVLRARLGSIRERIADAARRAGRDPGSVTLVAVSKTFPVTDIRTLFGSGQLDFGENRVQEGHAKAAGLSDLPLRWHLLGHLQSNKVRKALEVFTTIHSVDDEALMRRIGRTAVEIGRQVDVLVQVNLAGEATKSGAAPEAVRGLVDAALESQGVRLRGLMLLPPAVADPEDARPWFARLRELRDSLAAEGVPADALAELSMGMSHDFEVAVEEGATIVRVGTAIFGGRQGRV